MQRASCLKCHQRKLKCSREESGCTNCQKINQLCEYPAAEARARRKRGPYRKRSAIRDQDLSEELKVTEAKYRQLVSQVEEQNRGNVLPSPAVVDNDYYRSAAGFMSNPTPYSYDFSDPGTPQIPSDQLLRLWHVFVEQVDPVTKIVHRPSLQKKIFAARDSVFAADDPLQTLVHSICYTAVASTSGSEAERRFGEKKDVLLTRYQTAIEKSIALAHMSQSPDFMTLQALILYIVTLRRREGDQQLWLLFGLAVRMAQLLNLGSDDSASQLSSLEIELRRRAWWMLCWLEKRCAEDVASQTTSIMTWSQCGLPLNVNDDDLDDSTTQPLVSRIGVTDMTFCLVRFEMFKLFFDLFSTKPDPIIIDPGQRQINLAFQKETLLRNTKDRLKRDYLVYCDSSRPFDWMTLTFAEGFLAKADLMGRRSAMTDDEVFRLSMIVLDRTYLVQTDPRAHSWSWVFRDFVQSHALVKVISELCKGSASMVNPLHINDAWLFIERIVVKIPMSRRRDPAVGPIITLMALARRNRASSMTLPLGASHQSQYIQPTYLPEPPLIDNCDFTGPLQAFPDAWATNAIKWGDGFLAAAITSPGSISSDSTGQSPAAFGMVGSGINPVNNSLDNSLDNYWSTTDMSFMNSSTNNIDWSHWNDSLDVFDTKFGPS